MSGKERRISPRKDCALPVRFRVVLNAAAPMPVVAYGDLDERAAATATVAARTVMEGQVVNLSERGLYFHSKEEISVGSSLEMYFTLPRELTGRNPEEVRCNARVVHVRHAEPGKPVGIGATVERFEPVAARRWYN